MPTNKLQELYQALSDDPERARTPFSEDLMQASSEILESNEVGIQASILGNWFKRYQPCMFAKTATERDLISICVLSEADFQRSDQEIAQKIQRARSAWKAQAGHGQRSAFVIVAVSKRLLCAAPNATLRDFARILCSHYLQKRVFPDQVHQDWLELWSADYTLRRRWEVGVNFFAAAGDGRWWNDHRIPAGIALSMNSVGHLVASEARREAMISAAANVPEITASRSEARRRTSGAEFLAASQTSVRSLPKALKLAMRTIGDASEQLDPSRGCVWSRATFLLRADPGERCPLADVNDDPEISNKDYTNYAGWYHTDVTIPSEYFEPDWTRPASIREPFALDFTYLHDRRSPDFRALAVGKQIRERTTLREIAVHEDDPALVNLGVEEIEALALQPSLTPAQRAEVQLWHTERGFDVDGLAVKRPEIFRALLMAPDVSDEDEVVAKFRRLAVRVAEAAGADEDLRTAFDAPDAVSVREHRSLGTKQEPLDPPNDPPNKP